MGSKSMKEDLIYLLSVLGVFLLSIFAVWGLVWLLASLPWPL